MSNISKPNKQKRRKAYHWVKEGENNNHHILPSCRKGKLRGNTVRIDVRSHEAWHFLFGVMTFEEVAERLIQIEQVVKHNPKISFNFNHFFEDKKEK